jgi:hypothetical protein
MTRMLYTGFVMNNKPNLPGEVDPRTKEFSIRAQWRVNHWAFAAILLSVAGDLLAHCHKDANDWPVALRFIISLCPLLPALLYVGSLRRWLRGMDELDLEITLKVCLFAISATLYLDMALHPLAEWGVVRSNWWLVNWHSWWLQAVPLTCFYLLGTKIFTRRYK